MMIIRQGGSRNDVIYGTDDNEEIYGYKGDDELQGNGGDDQILGDKGDDILWGGDGNDHLWGGGGEDWIDAGRGENRVHGDAGDDSLIYNTGAFVIGQDTSEDRNVGFFNGGKGDDTFYFTNELSTLDSSATRILLYYEKESDFWGISVGGSTGYGGGVFYGLAQLQDIEHIAIGTNPGTWVEIIRDAGYYPEDTRITINDVNIIPSTATEDWFLV
jgi:Ca2+-binding RTX toxin-like protein